MTEQLIVRSAENYFEEYGRKGIGKDGADKWMVKRQLIDAFHKEIFSLLTLRLGPEARKATDADTCRIIRNVVRDTQHKWEKLCKMFAKYKETAGVLEKDDLKMEDQDFEKWLTSGKP